MKLSKADLPIAGSGGGHGDDSRVLLWLPPGGGALPDAYGILGRDVVAGLATCAGG